jgi:DNA topoisomerase-1
MILAGIGRYGPYVQHNGAYANLANADEVFEVGLNRAVVALAEKKAGGGRGARGSASGAALKELGEHPVTGKPVRLLAGRFGPYIKHEAVNANVPKGADPMGVTLEEAIALLAAREGQGGSKKKTARGSAAKAATAKSSPAATKTAAMAKAAPSKAKPAAAAAEPKRPTARKKAS